MRAIGRFIVWVVGYGIKLYFEFHGMTAPEIIDYLAMRDVER